MSQLGAGGAVNRATDPAARCKLLVRGIDDRVSIQARDIDDASAEDHEPGI
jgi:hypothetical protein